MFQELSTINAIKAQGQDSIPGWLLKENADLLSDPVTDILDTSYHARGLPSPILGRSWRRASSKTKPIKDVSKHFRPIPLTPILSKIAENHIVEKYVKPAVLWRKSIRDSLELFQIPPQRKLWRNLMV